MNLLALLALSAASLFGDLKWRPIGPLRGGRTKAATGVAAQPGVFYIGAVDGGVWKTDDYGRTWKPIFDEEPTGSIGALAVSASNPDVIYAGSGEGLQRPDLSVGDGIYRSTDGGRSWTHLGLRDAQQIPQIAVDPNDPRRLFVAVLGHPYGASEERGIFRSIDGGETFEKVLYQDPDTGAADVVIDPSHPQTVYAVLWEARHAPWENGEFRGPGSGLYKSVDGGGTWKKLEKGLPDFAHDGLGRIGLGIAPSRTSRLFATVEAKKNAGLYRSDDGGESWLRVNSDERVTEREDDFAEVKVDPQDPDVVYTASVVVWKSRDGGKTFSAFRGAPGGDDYQKIWIDPRDPRVLLIASDQGAIVTVNGGQSFSSWYNQPTAQMFHVTADTAFPYRLCGGQQDSGSACVASRGRDGAITFRDWRPAGIEEYGYAAPDPLHPDIVYGGKVSRWDRRTGQTQEVGPVETPRPDVRVVRTQPLVFSPADPHLLFHASNTVWKTRDGGRSWTRISPDLTRARWAAPPNVGKYRQSPEAKPIRRGVIYALAPSPREANLLWAGTDDGLIHLTRDGGKSWRDVTPPQLVPWAKVSILEAGQFDEQTAYAAINTLRLDDLRPHILRTHDGGKSWSEIVRGLPESGVVNVVREDPRRKGLLYAGTEQAVFVSFDDGDDWQPLRLNMPAVSIRDLVLKDDDIAVATHGRGFWILDDREPLLEMTGAIAREDVHLFRPAVGLRVRFDVNTDTPLPPDEPAMPNPEEGAAFDYLLGRPGQVTLQILDAAGALVRSFSSDERQEPIRDQGNIPRWWIRPARVPSAQAGLHRFFWDLHYPPPRSTEPSYPMSAIPAETPREPRGPWALPGNYRVRLIAHGETVEQRFVLRMDPRLSTPPAALRQQFELSRQLAQAMDQDFAAIEEAQERQRRDPSPQLQALLGEKEPDRPWEKLDEKPALVPWNARLGAVYALLQGNDEPPTAAMVRAARQVLQETAGLLARWQKLKAAPPAAPPPRL